MSARWWWYSHSCTCPIFEVHVRADVSVMFFNHRMFHESHGYVLKPSHVPWISPDWVRPLFSIGTTESARPNEHISVIYTKYPTARNTRSNAITCWCCAHSSCCTRTSRTLDSAQPPCYGHNGLFPFGNWSASIPHKIPRQQIVFLLECLFDSRKKQASKTRKPTGPYNKKKRNQKLTTFTTSLNSSKTGGGLIKQSNTHTTSLNSSKTGGGPTGLCSDARSTGSSAGSVPLPIWKCARPVRGS